ncbi:bifunctional DNA primase/polymerase [Pseudonocardia sp. RS010]|uniref:bifunctional DNA primase/polymerase n=1 Tax=Pseudonocardia sp. RS010 TaxID=3385979 RepID=UPI0039A2FCB4
MTIPTTIPAVGRWSVQGRELLGSVGPTWQAADDHLRGDVMADPGRPQPPRDQPRRRTVRPPRPTRLMQAALDAAAAGLYVFPVSPKGKLPAIKEWEDAATRDPQLIEEWWSARPWNLGLAVGRSNVLVVDLDPHRGAEPPVEFPGARGGADVLARLAAEAGQPDPVDTYTVTTPSGGEHRYFLMPEGLELRNTQGRLGWKIDTRGHGGFVVGAGSVRADGLYRVSRHGAVAPLPGWLAHALTPPPPPPPAEPLQLTRRRADAYLQKILDDELEELAAAQAGTRHDARLKAARTLGRLVAGGELDEHSARDLLLQAAAGHIGADTRESEVIRDVEDGLEYGKRLPRTLRRRHDHEHRDQQQKP